MHAGGCVLGLVVMVVGFGWLVPLQLRWLTNRHVVCMHVCLHRQAKLSNTRVLDDDGVRAAEEGHDGEDEEAVLYLAPGAVTL